ncbi:MAG: hypothetical protein AMJ90_05455 [candidate division Zixibacteria bacterium SM23_73_2]|nr:MAG: hypothetical protein AMJ90_05455 [candidate division Zixibacteria bacterium SM23_73_2]
MTLGSTQKGKIVESLIAASCILGSDGKLSVSIPLVDDEGVDIIFTPKGGGRSIFVQVKSRFTLTKKGNYRSQIRKKNFSPRQDLYIIFVYYDSEKSQLGETLWFVPSHDFEKNLKGQSKKRKNYIFQSRFTSQQDMWVSYKLKLRNLPQHILQLIKI